MRDFSQMPTSVTVLNNTSAPLDLGGYIRLEAAEEIVLDLTKLSEVGGAYSPKAIVWRGLARAALNSHVVLSDPTPDPIDPAVSAGLDGFPYNPSDDTDVLRPGLPGFVPAPAVIAVSVADGVEYADLTFDKGVYAAGGDPLGTDDVTASIEGGTATSVTVTAVTNTSDGALTGGESAIRFVLDIDGQIDGTEVVTLAFANGSIEDAAGNSIGETQAVFTVVGETVAPTWDVAPAAQNEDADSFEIAATLDSDGLVYVHTVDDGDPAPDAATVIANGVLAVSVEGVETVIEVSGLSASTAYDAYVLGVDEWGNQTASVTKVDVSTTA